MTDADAPLSGTVAPGSGQHLLSRTFDEVAVTGLRHAVAACARAAGLHGDRLDDFVLAVNELLTNAVRHGGGQGALTLWRVDATVVCEVADTGQGMRHRRHEQSDRPPLDTPGGWGLWLVGKLTDGMRLDTGSAGSAVRIWSAVGPAPAPPEN